MTDQITPTHLTRASDLDGLHGVYEYEPGDKIKKLAEEFKWKMEVTYNTIVWTSHIEDIIKTIGIEESTKEGKFSTRFMKEWKRRYKLDPNNKYSYPYQPVTEAGAIIGDLHKQIIKRKPCRVYWRITADINGVMEGTGENSGYGNPHSCWYGYGDFSNSPDILEECNGAGLLIGTGEPVNLENGVGRIWMVNGTDGIILFNPYLDLNDGVNRNQNDKAEFYADLLLKEVFKYPYETIPEWQVKKYIAPNGDPIRVIPVDIEHDPEIYVNYDTGWMITTEKYPDVGEPLGESGYYCENCGERIRPGDHFTSPDGDILCEDCFWEYYTYCNQCDETISRDDATYNDDGEAYCQECYEELYTQCEECRNEIRRDDAIIDEYGDVYCEACYNDTHVICDRCEREISTNREPTYRIDDDSPIICEECYNELIAEQDQDQETQTPAVLCARCRCVIEPYEIGAETDEGVYCYDCNQWRARMEKLFKEDPDQLWRELAGDRWDEVEAIIKAKQDQEPQPEDPSLQCVKCGKTLNLHNSIITADEEVYCRTCHLERLHEICQAQAYQRMLNERMRELED